MRAAEWCRACVVLTSRSRSIPPSSVWLQLDRSAGRITSRADASASAWRRSAPVAKLLVTLGRVAAQAAVRKLGSEASVLRAGSIHPTRRVERTSSRTAARIWSWERSGLADVGEEMLTSPSTGRGSFVVPQTLGEFLQHREHDARVLAEHLVEPRPGDAECRDRRRRHDARRARTAVDEGDLAEEVPWDEPVEPPPRPHDLGLAREQHV